MTVLDGKERTKKFLLSSQLYKSAIYKYGILNLNSNNSDYQVTTVASEVFAPNLNLSYINSGATSGTGNITIPDTFGELSFTETKNYDIFISGARPGTINLDPDDNTFVSTTN